MKEFNFPQLSEEWYRIRHGIPTASNFGRIITPRKGFYSIKSALGYIYELIADQCAPVKPWDLGFDGFRHNGMVRTSAMAYGIDTEPEARARYELETGNDVRQVGFCLSDCGRMGCSPDGLVSTDGGLELKCPLMHTHCAWLDADEIPDEHKAQVYGSMLITGRDWWDFCSYSVGLPPLIVRAHRSDEFFSQLDLAMQRFLMEYANALCRFAMFQPPYFTVKQQPVAI